jgi:hypothetical protein
LAFRKRVAAVVAASGPAPQAAQEHSAAPVNTHAKRLTMKPE